MVRRPPPEADPDVAGSEMNMAPHRSQRPSPDRSKRRSALLLKMDRSVSHKRVPPAKSIFLKPQKVVSRGSFVSYSRTRARSAGGEITS